MRLIIILCIFIQRITIERKSFFKTFGCRTNIYDTELLKSYVKDYEIVNDEEKAQIIVVNSCTVTNGADSGIKSYINSMQKRVLELYLRVAVQ